MDVYQNLWTSCDDTHLHKHTHLIAAAVLNQGLFQQEDDKLLKAHVREVNTLLNNNKTRDRGLGLLVDLVPQCAQQVLTTQCERWFRFCSDAVAGVQKGSRVVQGCQVMTVLLRDLPCLPDLQRHVSSKSSANIVLKLAAIDPQRIPAALECLYEYVRAAPGPCLQHKTVLEEHMLQHLDQPITSPSSPGVGVARLAGRVFAALPLPGVGGGNVTQSRADARGRQLGLMLGLAHSIMDGLLEGVLEKESFPCPREHASLKVRPVEDVTSDPTTARLLSIARLCNTLTFVAEMVTDPANAAVTITPDHLLSVVARLLQMEPGVLARYKSQEHRLVAFFLPSLHNQALLLLKDMTDSLGDIMDSYHNILADLLVSVLRSYKTCGGRDKEEASVWFSGGLQTRVLAYGVLAGLIRASRGRHAPPPGLVVMVVEDASPQERRVKLQEKGLASLSLHKATGKKKGYTVTSQSSVGALSGPLPRPRVFGRLARAALVVAEMLFTHATHSISFEDHQRLQTGVLSIAEGVAGAGQQPPPIYSEAKVRVQLYTALAALSAAPHPRSPPPYTLITHLLQTASMDTDMQVASACQVALCALSLVVANPKVELASQTFHQRPNDRLGMNGDAQDEGKDAEVDMIIEQLEEEEEEEEEENQEEEEEVVKTGQDNEMADKEEEEEEEEDKKEDEEEEEEGVGKAWDLSGSEESEDKELEKDGKEITDEEKTDTNKTEELEEEEEKLTTKKGGKKGKGRIITGRKNEKEDEEKDEEIEITKKGRNRRKKKGKGKKDDGESKETQETKTKTMKRKTENEKQGTKNKETEEKEETAPSKTTAKRNASDLDTPAKKVKASSDQQSGRSNGGRELSVEEMLKDFVDG